MKVYRNSWKEQTVTLKLKQSQADILARHNIIVHPQILE